MQRLLLVIVEAEGTVPGSYHAPRGMLEFWVDPDSPYHKKIFADQGKEFVLFCGAGWRSALAAKTLQDMGMGNVAHIDGGPELAARLREALQCP